MKPNQARMTRRSETAQSDQQSDDTAVRDDVCSECDAETVVISEDTGERICKECGLVVESNPIDRGPEWKAFTPEEQREKSRVGRPMTLTMHDKGLTTDIDWQDIDADGRMLDSQKRQRATRLRTWQTRIRTQNQNERNLQHALGELNRMSSALAIPYDVRETAASIYREALDEGLLPGRSIEGIATASLYVACQKKQIPRCLTEFGDVSRVEQREIARAKRYLTRELELTVEPVRPQSYLPRFCSALGVSPDVQRTAKNVVDITTEAGLHAGKSPPGFAAAAIYVAANRCGVDLTQQSVADVAHVTEVTIRNRYREQVEAIGDTSVSGNRSIEA